MAGGLCAAHPHRAQQRAVLLASRPLNPTSTSNPRTNHANRPTGASAHTATRFEVPFNIWCEKCGEHIAQGVRFNAEKQAVGSYHSTKVWAFSMRHHCGSRIVIETDPKNAEYVVKAGARRKVEDYEPEDAGLPALPDEAERQALAADPLATLERSTLQAQAAAGARAQLAALAADREGKRDGYALNKRLRASLRASKKEDARLDARWALLIWMGGG